MSHNNVETINYRGIDIEIIVDDDAQSPDNWGNDDVFLVYDHRDFYVDRKGYDPNNIFEAMQAKQKTFDGYYYFPLFAYIHSGVALSLGKNTYPFSCPWDTSFKGFVLVKREKYNWTRKQAHKSASSLVNVWNDYLSGNVYGYNVEDIDSCWGFYGDYESNGMIDEAKQAIDSHIREQRKSHFRQLKTWIKNKVPLFARKPLESNFAY